VVLVIAVVGGVAYYLLAGAGKTYAVPLVNGEPVATAQAQIKAQHLRSTLVYRNSNSVKANTVINSSPRRPAYRRTLVTLFVSRAGVAVPNVVGQQQDQAASTLQSKGFKVDTKTDATSSSPAGQVISQNPSGGTAAPGATITITVSGGAVSVPSVVGDSQATATQILTNAGFQVSVQNGSGPANVANGTVFSQNPQNGTATKGATVPSTCRTARQRCAVRHRLAHRDPSDACQRHRDLKPLKPDGRRQVQRGPGKRRTTGPPRRRVRGPSGRGCGREVPEPGAYMRAPEGV
jgi:serine/threonine-protein kinase